MSFLNCKGKNQVNEPFWRVMEFGPFLRGKNRFDNDRKLATSLLCNTEYDTFSSLSMVKKQ